jgi:hypothetical protein
LAKQEHPQLAPTLPLLSNGSTELADDLESAAPPAVPVAGQAADDVLPWDEQRVPVAAGAAPLLT